METLVVIHPLSTRRGDAPLILEELMEKCQLNLIRFRAWSICNMTWHALLPESDAHINFSMYPSWVCLFVDKEGLVDPTERINDYCGPVDMTLWRSAHLRYKYGSYKKLGRHSPPEDRVVFVSSPERIDLEKGLLFKG